MPVFETRAPIAVAIELPQGEVHLIASDRTDSVVAVNPSDRTRDPDVEAAGRAVVDYTGGTLTIRVPKARTLGRYGGIGRSGSVDVTVELPEGSDLRAEAGFAEFRADGLLGAVTVKAGAGNVTLDHTGALQVQSGAGSVLVERAGGRTVISAAGDMRIGGIAGEADIKNLNGKTWVGEVTGKLTVKSANGDITVEAAHADVVAKTANGSIHLGQVVRGSIVMETSSGGLEVGVRDGTAAWVDASTRFGRVHNHLSAAGGPETAEDTVEVRARTAFGEIVIRRS